MPIGIGTYAVRHYPYPQSTYVLDWAAQHGVDVEIIDSWANFHEFTDSQVGPLKDDLRRRGLSVPAVCPTNMTLSTPETAARNVPRLTRAIEVAARLSAPVVNVSLVQSVEPRSSRSPAVSEVHYETIAQHVRRAARQAADVGVRLSIELHEHTLVDTSEALMHLLELVGDPSVGVNPDLGNAMAAFPVPRETWRDIMPRLKARTNYWHVKNFAHVSFGAPDQGTTIEVPLGAGDIDYRLVMRYMMEDPAFTGYICIEAERSGDPFPLLESGIAYLRSLEAEVGA